MTTRRALFACLLLAPTGAAAQIISVPLDEPRRIPVTVTAGFGFLQSQGRVDGQSDAVWEFGEAMQYRVSAELGFGSGAMGVAGSLATLPIRRFGGTALPGSSGDIDLRQLLVTFRTPETEGPHQILDLGLGVSQWADYRGTDQLTASEAAARNAFTLAIGYGFGFTLGRRASFMIVQDMTTLWGSADGLEADESRMVRQYTTRISGRLHLTGPR